MLTKFSLQKTESPATTDVRPSKIGAEFSGVSPLTPAGEGAATQVLRSSGSEGTGSGVSSTETEMCPTPESADSGVNAENNIDKNCAPVTAISNPDRCRSPFKARATFERPSLLTGRLRPFEISCLRRSLD